MKDFVLNDISRYCSFICLFEESLESRLETWETKLIDW